MNSLDEEVQMKLLQIDSSARTSSVTRRLTAKFAEEWRKNHPDGEVIQRDLCATILPQITDDWNATHLEESKLTPAHRSYLSTSDELIEELKTADTVVIGAPMYNFTIPSQLKAWFDRIVIAGKTFSYSEAGAKGLAGGKKVIIVSSRGGLFAPGTPQQAYDFQETYLRAILGFIGIEDIEIVRAEGLAYGPEQREAAMRAALACVSSVVAGSVPAKAA